MALITGDDAAATRCIDEAERIGQAAGSTNSSMLVMVLRLMAAWQRGDHDAAMDIHRGLQVDHPELTVYLSSLGGWAWAFTQADAPTEATALLDRAASIGLDHLPVDAEWLPNLVNLVRTAVAVEHPMLTEVVEELAPYADLVAVEGIGAGLYGSVARILAEGARALGRHEDAERWARQGLEVNRRFGGTLVADSLRTLAECLADGGAAPAEVQELHDAADAAYEAAGALHLLRRSAARPALAVAGTDNHLRRDGDVWHMTYLGRSTIVKHSKGLADLAVLLDRAGSEVHVRELEGVAGPMLDGRGDDALDPRAIAAYKDRLRELAEELDDAESAHDLGRAERARVEQDALLDQLSGALGLGDRRRAAGPDPVDRLRKAVSARIRDAIRRIGEVHPELGHHLQHAVRTGVYCSYRPEQPVVWQRQTRSGAHRA